MKQVLCSLLFCLIFSSVFAEQVPQTKASFISVNAPYPKSAFELIPDIVYTMDFTAFENFSLLGYLESFKSKDNRFDIYSCTSAKEDCRKIKSVKLNIVPSLGNSKNFSQVWNLDKFQFSLWEIIILSSQKGIAPHEISKIKIESKMCNQLIGHRITARYAKKLRAIDHSILETKFSVEFNPYQVPLSVGRGMDLRTQVEIISKDSTIHGEPTKENLRVHVLAASLEKSYVSAISKLHNLYLFENHDLVSWIGLVPPPSFFSMSFIRKLSTMYKDGNKTSKKPLVEDLLSSLKVYYDLKTFTYSALDHDPKTLFTLLNLNVNKDLLSFNSISSKEFWIPLMSGLGEAYESVSHELVSNQGHIQMLLNEKLPKTVQVNVDVNNNIDIKNSFIGKKSNSSTSGAYSELGSYHSYQNSNDAYFDLKDIIQNGTNSFLDISDEISLLVE
ncbi:hypothetical protein N9O57_01485 [bacterium]|nr:hypothetical protein [bacterium]